MTLDELNSCDFGAFTHALSACCGASSWATELAIRRPFADAAALHNAAREVWRGLHEREWLEAFSHHPRIGDIESLRKKFAATANWAANEQLGASTASRQTLEALAAGNGEYEARFGFIFIVCATGKSAEEMLSLLSARLGNDRNIELRIAAAEQEKIMHLRIDKLLERPSA